MPHQNRNHPLADIIHHLQRIAHTLPLAQLAQTQSPESAHLAVGTAFNTNSRPHYACTCKRTRYTPETCGDVHIDVSQPRFLGASDHAMDIMQTAVLDMMG